MDKYLLLGLLALWGYANLFILLPRLLRDHIRLLDAMARDMENERNTDGRPFDHP